MRIGQHETHPAADAWPMLTGDDRIVFLAGVKAFGRCDPNDPVVLIVENGADLILDGRNRYYAFDQLGIEPLFRYFDRETEGDPYEYAMRRNYFRRHQELVSRVLSAERVSVLDKGERKRLKKMQALLPGVSLETTEMAKRINEDAEPEVIAAVHSGEIDAAKAAALSQLEPDEQREGLERIRDAKAKEEKPKPVRAVKAHESTAYQGGELSPTMRAALTTMCRIAEKSVHAEAGHGAQFVREVFGLGRA